MAQPRKNTSPASKHPNEELRPSGQRPCPICQDLMVEDTEANITVDFCAAHGVWLDRGELDQILQRTAQSGHAQRRAKVQSARRSGITSGLFFGIWGLLEPSGPIQHPSRARHSLPPTNPDRSDDSNRKLVPEGARPCPICDAVMETEAKDSLLIDCCGNHGIWLDHDELAALTASVRSRMQRSTSTAVRKARRKGAVDANIFGLFAFLD